MMIIEWQEPKEGNAWLNVNIIFEGAEIGGSGGGQWYRDRVFSLGWNGDRWAGCGRKDWLARALGVEHASSIRGAALVELGCWDGVPEHQLGEYAT